MYLVCFFTSSLPIIMVKDDETTPVLRWMQVKSVIRERVIIGGIILHMTSPILTIFIQFLACTLRNIWSTFTLKDFCHIYLIFGIITHLLKKKGFLRLVLNYSPKYNSWGVTGIQYWRFVKKSKISIIYNKLIADVLSFENNMWKCP